jgi:hypothetical protein
MVPALGPDAIATVFGKFDVKISAAGSRSRAEIEKSCIDIRRQTVQRYGILSDEQMTSQVRARLALSCFVGLNENDG